MGWLPKPLPFPEMLRVAAFWLGQDEGTRCCAELQHCFEKSYCGLLSCEVGRIRLAGAWVRELSSFGSMEEFGMGESRRVAQHFLSCWRRRRREIRNE